MSQIALDGPFPDTVTGRTLDALGPAVRGMAGPLLVPFVAALVSELQATDEILAPERPPSAPDSADSWARAFDLDLTPFPRWLGIATGSPVPRGLTEEMARDFIRNRGPWRRGTPGAIIGAARAHLSGGKRVEVFERDGSPWRLRIKVYASELAGPNALALLTAAVTAQKPVGIVLTIEVAQGAEYDHFTAQHGTYDDLSAEFPTYDDMTYHVPEEI